MSESANFISSIPSFQTGTDSAPGVFIPGPVSETKKTNGREAGRAGGSGLREPIQRLPPKPSNARYQSLDMWRGAACLMLLLYHATFYADLTFHVSDPSSWSLAGLPLNLIRKCWVGVPIFFVISGYCISASIDSLRRRDHSLWDYFVRRVRRIYPPLWVMCGISILFTLAMQTIPAVHAHCLQLPKLSELTVWNWLGNFGAAEAWMHNLVGDKPNYLMANTWTLCYEEQFYLLTGLMLAFTARRFFAATAIVTIAVLCIRHALRLAGLNQVGFFWDGHWMMFAAGILIYHALTYQTVRQRLWTCGLLVGGMIYGVVDRMLSVDPMQKHLAEYLVVSSLFGLTLIVLRRWDAVLSRHWALAPLDWCGKRSYSIYLTHFPLVVVASSVMALGGLRSELSVATIVVPVCILLSLPVAWVFYVTVERRFLNAPAVGGQ